jgi:hypothetical protein
MLTPEIFVRFVSSKGRKLSEINPGSDEVALVPAKAIEALKLLEGSQVAVLGGDVLSDSSGKLAYNYENWYCEQLPGESPLDFVRRSQSIAHDFLAGLAMRHDPNLFVVLVHSELGVD